MRKFALSILPLALVAAPLAVAAPKPPPPAPHMQMAPAPASAPSVNSATLHKFASAYEDVMHLRMKYMTKIKSAKSDKDKTALKQQARKEMKQDISKHMPVSQYIKVAKAVNTNPALREKLIKIIRSDHKSKKPSAPSRR